MEKPTSSTNKEAKLIRWIARILSAFFIVVCLFFFIGETFFEEHHGSITGDAILGLSICGVSLLGLALAWRWEFAGAALALVAFFIIGFENPEVLVSPLLIVPATALLFLICWWMDRKHDLRARVE